MIGLSHRSFFSGHSPRQLRLTAGQPRNAPLGMATTRRASARVQLAISGQPHTGGRESVPSYGLAQGFPPRQFRRAATTPVFNHNQKLVAGKVKACSRKAAGAHRAAAGNSVYRFSRIFWGQWRRKNRIAGAVPPVAQGTVEDAARGASPRAAP